MNPVRTVSVVKNERARVSEVQAFVEALRAGPFDVAVHETRTLDEGVAVAGREVARGVDVLVAAGGDGTVLSVVDAASRHGVRVGALALGTASDLACHVGTKSRGDLVRAITTGTIRPVDVLECEFTGPDGTLRTLPFVTTAGAGVLGAVAERERAGAAKVLKGGLGNASWPLLFSMAWRSVRGATGSLAWDGAEPSSAAPLDCFEVCKVHSPGGFRLAPGARLESGTLHAFYFGGLSMAQFSADVARCLRKPGGHLDSRRVEYVSDDPSTNRDAIRDARRVTLRTSSPLPVHVQGEYVGTSPVTFRVSSRRLDVYSTV
ncbi:MAG: diacylglycerol kinase family protein [Polyangiaceae bacterium]